MPFSSARFPRPSLLALALSATLPALAQQAADPALERVVVTATRGTKAIDKIPGAVSVITAQEIETQTLVAEDLSQVLSVLAPSYAPSRQKLTSFGESMRGRTALLLFDGVPQSNPLRNGAREGYFADPSLIERIEVISGASAAQGLGATGGIINFISRTPREAGTRQRVELKYGTQGHSDDALWKAGYTLEHKSGFDALLHVGATLRGVGVDGDGRRLGLEAVQGDTQDSRAGDVFLKLGRDFGPQRLQLSVNRFRVAGEGDWKPVAGNRATALPTSAAPGTPPGRPPRNDVRTVSLDWSHGELAGGQAHAQVYKQDFSALYGATAATTFQDTSIAPQGRLFDQSEVVADKAGVKLSWVRPDLFVDGLELTTGLDWLKDTSQQRLALTGRTWVPPLKFTSTAPFAQLEYEVGAFTVRGGARRESAKLAVDGYQTLAFYKSTAVQGGERSFSQWVKSLGAVWRLGGGWSTFVSYNEGFGVPDVGLVLRAGEVLGLLGPNGAGKSTTVGMICGLTVPDAGTVTLSGGVGLASDAVGYKRRIGLVPQDIALYEELPARMNVELFGALYGMAPALLRRRAGEVLDMVGLADRARDKPATFSGGMKRRLNIACALVHDPEILLLDEPTAGVDPQSRNAIFDNLVRLKRAGKALVYTTHYMEEAERLADRITIIDHGRVVAEGTQAQLFARLPAAQTLHVEIDGEPDDALLSGLPGVQRVGQRLDISVGDIGSDAGPLLAALARRGIAVRGLASARATLEDVFLQLTGRALRD